MQLVEALEIVHRPAPRDGPAVAVQLACGFEPLHLTTFLTAELRTRLPEARVDLRTGLFDDLPGNIRRGARGEADALAVVIEWADLDPRLGLRRLGGWGVDDVPSIVSGAVERLQRLEHVILEAAGAARVVCVMPTLPLPPLFPEPPARGGAAELELRAAVAAGAARLASQARVSVASAQRLAELSPPGGSQDVQSDLHTGFPYATAHAAAVGGLLAELIAPAPARRGLITDLDDSLWAGLLDEDGVEGISWTATAHRHGLYQQLLASLAGAGVLIGVASRNDPALVAAALDRPDLLIAPDRIFPVEATSGDKPAAIRRILGTWGIAADAAVFVDDSPLELDAARHELPGLETVRFPAGDDGVWPLLHRLRVLFAKDAVTPEDRLRLQSVRSGAELRAAHVGGAAAGDFLAGVDGVIEIECPGRRPERALELLNKANQFHLNGRRLAMLGGDAELVTVTYSDRYGPLGLIGALVVTPDGRVLRIGAWAMSCRALARRIEHHTLGHLFDRFGAHEVELAYAATPRNLALQEFLAEILGEPPREPVRITDVQFQAAAPPLVHRVTAE